MDSEIVRILREEYGISSMDELDKAIAKMSKLDISPFCGKTAQEEKIA